MLHRTFLNPKNYFQFKRNRLFFFQIHVIQYLRVSPSFLYFTLNDLSIFFLKKMEIFFLFLDMLEHKCKLYVWKIIFLFPRINKSPLLQYFFFF